MPKRSVEVCIGKPEPSPNGLSFRCPFQVRGLPGDKVRYIYGTDSMHALQLALKVLPARLQGYQIESQDKLYWLEEGDDLGFPEP